MIEHTISAALSPQDELRFQQELSVRNVRQIRLISTAAFVIGLAFAGLEVPSVLDGSWQSALLLIAWAAMQVGMGTIVFMTWRPGGALLLGSTVFWANMLVVVAFVLICYTGFALGWRRATEELLLLVFYLHAFPNMTTRRKVVLSSVMSTAFLIVLYLSDARWGLQIVLIVVFINIAVAALSMSLESSLRDAFKRRMVLEELALTDKLTGALNRHSFMDLFEQVQNAAARSGLSMGVLIADIDDFKAYNDSLGHLAGDEALTEVAHVLRAAQRHDSDLVVRFGGEEFVCVFLRQDLTELQVLCQGLVDNVRACKIPHPASKTGPFLTISIGACLQGNPKALDRRSLMTLADRALYKAKSDGRDRVFIAQSED
ncbi:GGDEF domain-containing protein [Salinispirillum sp. LH 10-3-1]|uniref:diguanylate cyclase n=1 Tax=Salinispirillum sp. LH 10-3-1 TaxID=2952525 RepID=A0AB38YEZ3_9GAMM